MAIIGVVKVDLHKSERNFENISLSDENVVKWLVLYRDKIDLYYGEKTDNFYDHAGNVKELNKELINLYASLDDLIKRCEFKMEQLALLKLLFMGYTFNDIEKLTKNATSNALRRRFKTICKTIIEMNNRLWKIYIHKNYLDTPFRKCTKCNMELPLTDCFFYREQLGKEGYKRVCKKC